MKLVEIISMIQSLIDKINARTGATDTTLAEAVNRVTSGNMVDTSGATATESDIEHGKTAFVNGVEITGNLRTSSGAIFISDDIKWEDSGTVGLRFNAKITEKTIYRANSSISIKTSKSNLGDATEEDVTAGKTFTSAAGLKKTGTAEMFKKKSGTVEIAGDAKSFKIDTGLNTIDAIIVYKTSSSNSTFFWVYSGIVKALAYANTSNKLLSTSTTFYTSGGTITCNANLEQYPIKAGTYKWVAYGN